MGLMSKTKIRWRRTVSYAEEVNPRRGAPRPISPCARRRKDPST